MIYIAGAGPGAVDLITVRAREILSRADFVLFDSLVSPEILDLAPRSAKLIRVGKRVIEGSRLQRNPPCRTVTRRDSEAATQDAINDLLVDLGRTNPRATIVRLKGGDPFVFGRGGEEAASLAAAGLAFEVIPGVASAIAAPAFAGIPVTMRGLASSVTFVSAQSESSRIDPAIDFAHFARDRGTLVFLMGAMKIREIASELIRNGMPPDRPAAAIQWGSLPNQFTITGRLDEIAARAAERGLGSPAVLVVGEVARLRETLGWFEARPLFGKRILLTRAWPRQRGATARYLGSRIDSSLRDLGAEVVEIPAIRVEPIATEAIRDRLANLGEYTDLIFTSGNAVAILFDAADQAGLSSNALARIRIIVMGPGTADVLRARTGLTPAIVAADSTAEGLLAELGEIAGRRFLFPRAESARDVIPAALGGRVDVVPIYRTVPSGRDEIRRVVLAGEIDVAVFASSSAARSFLAAFDSDEVARCIANLAVVAIGPVTADPLTKAGLAPSVAKTHDVEGVVQACLIAARKAQSAD